MEIKAQLNHAHISPRKVKLVSDLIKGLDYRSAKYQLSYLPKRSSLSLLKLLDSAAANAQHNLGLVKDNLYIKSLIVNSGPVLKRYRPKGFGSAAKIRRRTSHISIILDEKIPGLRSESGARVAGVAGAVPLAQEATNKGRALDSDKTRRTQTTHTHPEVSKEQTKRGFLGLNRLKKFFRRKTI